MLGVDKATCVEEVIQQSVLKEEPAYGRYEARQNTHRERERHKEV